MGEQTGISWCDHTFNPWIGCTKVSAGCANCYAERQNKFYGWVSQWGANGECKRTSIANWKQPVKWDVSAKADGVRRRVFCGSLCDVFEDRLELAEMRSYLFALIQATPNLDWLLLTKRPDNITGMLPRNWHHGWPNVWLGVSAENQEMADERIPLLLQTPAAVRFVSCEPCLGAVDLRRYLQCEMYAGPEKEWGKGAILPSPDYPKPRGARLRPCLDWVICGGESGPNARPMHPDWARSLRNECQAAGVPYFFKQWGEWAPAPDATDALREPGRVWPWSADLVMARVGKKAAGDLLDHRHWHEYPAAQS